MEQRHGHAWRPGWSTYVPWMALFALVSFVICCIGAGMILWASDGKDQATWPLSSHPVAVSVLLSLCISIGNLTLSFALSKAYEIAWWVKAVDGAKLGQLQFDIDVQTDLTAFFRRHISLDWFALAAVVSFAVSIVDGPLIQRASTTTVRAHSPVNTVINTSAAAAQLPANFGAFSGINTAPSLLMPTFGNVSRAYVNHDAIDLDLDGCGTNTTCTLDLPAPGFDIACTNSTFAYDYDSLIAGSATRNNLTAFNVTIDFGGPEGGNLISIYSTINITVTYKPDTACAGDMVRRACTLRLATVRYPLTVTGGHATMSAWQLDSPNTTVALTQIPKEDNGFYTLVEGSADGGFETMLGGVYAVLSAQYAATLNLGIATMTETPFIITTTGGITAASNYLVSDADSYGNCTMAWDDPTADLVNTARELILRSSLAYAAANRTAAAASMQAVPVQAVTVAVVYQSEFAYLGATVGCMVLEAVLVLVLLVGWRRLGRPLVLGPFELARALGAPLLLQQEQAGRGGRGGSATGSKAETGNVLAALRRQKIRYGEILTADEEQQRQEQEQEQKQGLDPQGNFSQDEESKTTGDMSAVALTWHSSVRLGLDHADRVGVIRKGVAYY